MSMSKTLSIVARVSKLLACLGIAAFVVVRSSQFSDNNSFSPLPAIMCCMFAVVLMLTGVALAHGSHD